MEEIITYLRQSIEDEILSKAEKKSLKTLIGDQLPDNDQLNFIRSKIYAIAKEKINADNYNLILDWVKNANSALIPKADNKSGAYFSPGDACRNAILRQIMYAHSTLDICVFTISDDRITNAIIDSHKRGRAVRIITDNDKSLDKGSDIARLAAENIPLKMDSTPNHMHHKFMVVDGNALTTGSYNWTLSAAKYNHENVLITSEPGIVKSFLKEFSELWEEMDNFKN